MSDFETFETAGAKTEEDPAADFLAREQDQLAELEGDDFGVASQNQPAGGENDFFGMDSLDTGSATATMPATSSGLSNDDIMAAFDTPVGDSNLFAGDSDPFSSNNVKEEVTPDNQMGDMGGDPMLDAFDTPADSNQDPIALGGDMGHVPEPMGYEAISTVDRQRQEPEKIKKWREEQKERLEKKDEESEAKKGEWREAAKKELEDWYKHKDEQLEKTFKLNREAEVAFIQERDDTIPGGEWERICRLCEFQPKASRNQKDVSRMRSILLQLKQSPISRS